MIRKLIKPTMMAIGKDNDHAFYCYGLEEWQNRAFEQNTESGAWQIRYELGDVPIGTHHLIYRATPALRGRTKRLDLFRIDGKGSMSASNLVGFIDNPGKCLLTLDDDRRIPKLVDQWKNRPAFNLDSYVEKIIQEFDPSDQTYQPIKLVDLRTRA
jgi:hypothetical protein